MCRGDSLRHPAALCTGWGQTQNLHFWDSVIGSCCSIYCPPWMTICCHVIICLFKSLFCNISSGKMLSSLDLTQCAVWAISTYVEHVIVSQCAVLSCHHTHHSHQSASMTVCPDIKSPAINSSALQLYLVVWTINYFLLCIRKKKFGITEIIFLCYIIYSYAK
jgi:hypothetical protein